MINSLKSSLDVEPRTLRAQVLSGSFMLLAGSGSVTVINFLYNITVARFLGPSGFWPCQRGLHSPDSDLRGHPILSDRFRENRGATGVSGRQEGSVSRISSSRLDVRHRRRAHLGGVSQCNFKLSESAQSILVIVMGMGAAFYVALGSRRGYLQGACRFRHLAINVVIEGLVRLGGSLLQSSLASAQQA